MLSRCPSPASDEFASATAKKCFVPKFTALRRQDRALILVEDVRVREVVRAREEGEMVRVVSVQEHPHRVYELVELTTKRGSIKVSDTHRIAVATEPGAQAVDREARLLEVG